MSDTLRLALPLLAAAQAQKHVTHNEALLRLDALCHLGVKTRQLATPPATPAQGDAYLVTGSASGDWQGQGGKVALWRDDVWHFFTPFTGLSLLVVDEAVVLVWLAGGWREQTELLNDNRRVARSAHGAETRLAVLEATLSGLSGAYMETPSLIPDRAVVFGVSCRTITAITGAASYDCGLASEPSKFGGSLGKAVGATNAGMIGPTAFYAPTPVRLTARGGDFTGGAVRLAVHCLLPVVPQQ